MKKTSILILVMSLSLVLTTALYAQAFRSDTEAYQYGYDNGHQLGMADREMGLDFNYKHSSQSGVTYFSYVNANFRTGFAEGYADGYDSRAARLDERRDERQEPYQTPHRFTTTVTSVTVFTRDDFQGAARTLGVGQYPNLEGKWNDSIASVQVNGAVRVILFDEPNFRGRQLILEQDSGNLGDYNFRSRAASMIVEPSE